MEKTGNSDELSKEWSANLNYSKSVSMTCPEHQLQKMKGTGPK